MKTLVFSAHPYEISFLEKAAEGKHELTFTDKKLTVETASEAAGFEAVAIFTADDASAPVVTKLNAFGVKYIALRSAGYDHLDLAKLRRLGMHAANVPAYSPYSIAEHAVALLMALNRKIVSAQMLIRMHDFRLDPLVGFDIHGKTVGIIGTGTIGVAFARIMKGFGAKVIAFDPRPHADAAELDIQYLTLPEVLRTSDIISIHCPLNSSTRYMIAAEQLGQMRSNAILINTSRGAVVNTRDLVEAVEEGRIAGACLDVYEFERPIFFEDHRKDQLKDALFSRLISNPNIIVTGHQAFLTNEALSGIAATTIESLDFWEDGQLPPNALEGTAVNNILSSARITVL